MRNRTLLQVFEGDLHRPACGTQNLTMREHLIITQQTQNPGLFIRIFMPYVGFKWVKPSLNGLADLNATSPIRRFYEVDLTYPKELHDKHNSLPFLPQNSIPPGSKVQKLMATFKPKKKYVVHYRNLQQALNNGLIVEKVHRVVQFNQSDWLAKYLALNTEMRKKAKNEFEKDFFKLLNNAVFGKTMENVRKRMEMELVSCDRRLQKLINKSTFKHCTTYSENLNAVTLENKIINFCGTGCAFILYNILYRQTLLSITIII